MADAFPPQTDRAPNPGRLVCTYGSHGRHGHKAASHEMLSRRLAKVLGFNFCGAFEHKPAEVDSYVIPMQVLCGTDTRIACAIAGEGDLFGGWVAWDYLADKTIMHPVLARAKVIPAGWSPAFARDAAPLTLGGISAFCAEDIVHAARQMLRHGPVRLKSAQADGGMGQVAVGDLMSLTRALDFVGDGACVVEENLTDVTTYSVGQTRLPGMVISYCGVQEQTRSNSGAVAYGGSRLWLVRGGFDALLARPLGAYLRAAVEISMRFDQLADLHLSGLIASRRNYDVAHGTGVDGQPRMGVIDQSWRAGGASGAELVAVEAFLADPARHEIFARTAEVYGPQARPPAGAVVYYHGDDPMLGPLLKYATEEPAHAGQIR
ncbi:MAG: DUF3182 family protein [Paracoccaceae bacterium]